MTTTTQKLKNLHPDLNFVKPLPVHAHPRYKQYDIKLRSNHRVTLSKGHEKDPGRKKILVDTVLEQDTQVPLRDGEHVYADIYRPQSSNEVKVPAAICWSPYGKSSISLDMLWNRSGVPKDWTSGYETFEGLDPADWNKRGYAVVNVDARGAQFSSGTFFFWGDQEAEDVYDTIDFLSKQPWCNGSVCMAGNSYLAKAQVNYASRQLHPALRAIAPWEGFTDIYRQLLFRGGFPSKSEFMRFYQWGVAGEHEVEDMEGMVRSHPLFDSYWNGKYDEVENIEIPMYVLASFCNPFHIYGSFDTFRRARSNRKWLRVHSTFEWYEMYEQKSNDDLQRFFDRYCKEIMNGWEEDTPPVRLSLLGCGSVPNIVERPEAEFPLHRQKLVPLYLDSQSQTLQNSQPEDEHSVSYEGHSLDSSSEYIFNFSEYTEVAGYAKVRLWMSCNEKDDMDVVVQIRKIDAAGNLLEGLNIPSPDPMDDVPTTALTKFLGPDGYLRASTMVSRDDSRTSRDGQEVFYKFDQQQKVPPGTIVPMDITLWPTGMVFAKGEGIMLRVAGHVLSAPIRADTVPQEPVDANLGRHIIHTGGKYDSCLTLPIIAHERS